MAGFVSGFELREMKHVIHAIITDGFNQRKGGFHFPSFEEGTMRRFKKMERYLRNGAARGGQTSAAT